MAFQAPQRQQAQRQQHAPPQLNTSVQQVQPANDPPAPEWVLFSPHASSGAETATISTAHTARTLGRSALSELDSLQTRAGRPAAEDHGIEEDDETEDLDSLDDGLHAFNVPGRPLHDSDTVLPVHDGLGTFAVQEQLWQHERYNPHRKHRPSTTRGSSSQHVRMMTMNEIVEEDNNRESEQETWRMRRIEEWRLEQSRAILEEIEKETRRRRRTTSRSATTEVRGAVSGEDMARPVRQTRPDIPAIHQTAAADEGFWTRFTRKVIQDLIGIDDATLCYIFGEDLVEEDVALSSTPRQSDILAPQPAPRNDLELARTGSTWEERLIARIAKELGILVDQLTEHPGAFSTYSQREEEHISYAGLTSSVQIPRTSSAHPRPTTSGPGQRSDSSPVNLGFEPTLRLNQTDSASQWGVEDAAPSASPSRNTPQYEREHWERKLDVKMVYDFIRNRILRRRTASPSAQRSSTAAAQTASYTQTAPTYPSMSASPTSPARAALIRAHHPLISSPQASAHRAQRRPLSPVVTVPQSLGSVLGRRVLSEGSCASQSSKRTRTSASVSRSTNYWDWAGPDGVAGWGDAGCA